MGFSPRKWWWGVAALLATAGCERRERLEPEAEAQRPTEPLVQQESLSGPLEQVRLVTGEVTAVSDDALHVAARSGEDVRLVLAPGTAVRVDGRPGTAADLREGSVVRATFDYAEGQPVALLVEVDRLDTAPPLQPEPLQQLPEPLIEERPVEPLTGPPEPLED